MDKALFTFSIYGSYTLQQIESFTREQCEELCNTDEKNVTKYDISQENGLQDLLNCECPDFNTSFVRVFI